MKLATWPAWARPIALRISCWRFLPTKVRAWFVIRSLAPEQIAFARLLYLLFRDAPIVDIKDRKSCSWTMTMEDSATVMGAVQDYVNQIQREFHHT